MFSDGFFRYGQLRDSGTGGGPGTIKKMGVFQLLVGSKKKCKNWGQNHYGFTILENPKFRTQGGIEYPISKDPPYNKTWNPKILGPTSDDY